PAARTVVALTQPPRVNAVSGASIQRTASTLVTARRVPRPSGPPGRWRSLDRARLPSVERGAGCVGERHRIGSRWGRCRMVRVRGGSVGQWPLLLNATRREYPVQGHPLAAPPPQLKPNGLDLATMLPTASLIAFGVPDVGCYGSCDSRGESGPVRPDVVYGALASARHGNAGGGKLAQVGSDAASRGTGQIVTVEAE